MKVKVKVEVKDFKFSNSFLPATDSSDGFENDWNSIFNFKHGLGPFISKKYLKVLENTWKYSKTLKGTWKYFKVLKNTRNYSKILENTR